jgi:glycosyltransferase involved in cell wall biosynthesis
MKWICCQLGAREHYAIPRALFSRGLLDCLVTDAWVPAASFLAQFPTGNLADRFHNELSNARVISFNRSVIMFEMLARVRRLSEWQTIVKRNEWFQRKVVSAIKAKVSALNNHPILLSYSYAALKPFRLAKARGWKTLLVQIDPGPEEERIVAEVAARVPALAGSWQRAPKEYWAAWREECNLADRIVVNSEWTREGLVRCGIPNGKLCVIPLAYEAVQVGDETSQIRQSRTYPVRFTQDRPMRVLFLGQVNLRKGIARLLEAARSLRDEPVEFWMVGPVQITNSAAEGDNPRVKWLGPVTRNQTADKYRSADVFILPTLSDGFAITQLEAQAYGLPVISSKFCASAVQNGRNGIVLEGPTAACIAAAIRDCVANPKRLETFAASSGLPNQFTMDTLGQRLKELGSTL